MAPSGFWPRGGTGEKPKIPLLGNQGRKPGGKRPVPRGFPNTRGVPEGKFLSNRPIGEGGWFPAFGEIWGSFSIGPVKGNLGLFKTDIFPFPGGIPGFPKGAPFSPFGPRVPKKRAGERPQGGGFGGFLFFPRGGKKTPFWGAKRAPREAF